MSKSVGKAVYNILSTDASVSALVGTRIYPVMARQGDKEPYVVYHLINSIPHDTKTGVSRVDFFRVQVNMVSSDYAELENISSAIRNAMDRAQHGTYNGVQVHGVKYLSEQDGLSDRQELFLKQADYQFRVIS